MRMHHTISLKRAIAAAERRLRTLDNPGFCYACGHEQEGCEPDATAIECEVCGEAAVHGSDDVLFELA